MLKWILRRLQRRRGAPAPDGEARAADDPSQAGEASYLLSLVGDGFPRSIVDVGAHDGVALSNSLPLVRMGWRAVLIEPLPAAFERLAANHAGNPRVACVNKACADRAGTRPLYIGRDGAGGMLSTLCTDDNEWFAQNRTDESIDVPVDTLTGILAEHGFPAEFGMLLVDAEGMDYEVLRGLDFARFRPRVVVSEEYPSDQRKHDAKYRLLRRLGYRHDRLIGCNTVWISR